MANTFGEIDQNGPPLPTPSRRLTQLFQNRLPQRMCVPEKHSGVTVAAYQGNLRHAQSHFKKATDSFVPKVMEAKV